MRLGGYKIVIEDEGREMEAIDSLGAPLEGREMLIEDSLYVVTRVRQEQDRDERAEADKIHTYPRVFIKRIGDAPTRPPHPDDPPSQASGSVLKFEVVPDNDRTEVDEFAEARARAAHEAMTRVFVRKIEDGSARRRVDVTDFDERADERALAAHAEQTSRSK